MPKISGDRLIGGSKILNHDVAIIGGVKLTDRFPNHIKYRVIGSNLYEN